jgi:hypothetical protein
MSAPMESGPAALASGRETNCVTEGVKLMLDLAARCEAASGPDRELDAAIAIEIFDGGAAHLDDPRDVTRARKVLISHGAQPGDFEVVGFSGVSLRTAPAYTASLDAAMTLMPKDWAIDCLKEGEVGSWYVNMRPRDWVSEWRFSKAATPALVLCAAALRARASVQP